jgi:enoyl-CoA hydratase/carnithine racemase
MEVRVISATNGFAISGEFELTLAWDILIAAEEAQFAYTHARVGVMPGGGCRLACRGRRDSQSQGNSR